MGFSTAALLVAILALLGPSEGIPQLRPAPGIPRCPQICPDIYAPVCGSNGQTYGNNCELRVAACEDPTITKASDGKCRATNPNCRPSTFCPFNYAPICGSDGKTYANECAFRNAACNDPRLTKVSDGECGSRPNCPDICPAVVAPVCGSDGRTYENECRLNAAACRNPSLRKVANGNCGSRPNCPEVCPANYDPVCGTDGKTYGNQCSLGAATCRNPSIQKAHNGECGSVRPPIVVCPQGCPFNFSPVCGSDGITYPNQCTLESASCKNSSIRKLYDGECRRPLG